MHATAISFGVPWSRIEKDKDHYDFSFLNWFITHTEEAGLKLVINLFNSNVCGKCEELTEGKRYPQYTPSYVKNDPSGYTRMILNSEIEYHPGGPPMCPNDPRTLEREVIYLRHVANHLKEFDTNHTVIMIQLNNEYFYQQWAENPDNTQKEIRCVCKYCKEKYDPKAFVSGEGFMFSSFAEYTRSLIDAFKDIYPLPMYLNSPWWAPYIIDVFLQTCPNLDFVGIDGVYSVVEPNQLTVGQRHRNLPFAAESPTEAPATKRYLTMLPYYTGLKIHGLGNLLWEAPEPNSVVYDKTALEVYQKALYPIKQAMIPLIEARNAKTLVVWYSQSVDIEMRHEIDIFGKLVELDAPISYANKGIVLVEGVGWKTVPDESFDTIIEGNKLSVSESKAGFILPWRDEWIIGSPGAVIYFDRQLPKAMEAGFFDKRNWITEEVIGPDCQRLHIESGLIKITM